jgi:hypothetical protein
MIPDGSAQRAGVDGSLYPDIASAGGLAEALTAVRERLGITTGPLDAPNGSLVRTGHGSVSLRRGERGFRVILVGKGFRAAEGVTDDLDEAARALDVWRAGTTLRALVERFGFLRYDGLAEAYENGTQVEYRWNEVLTDPDLAGYRESFATVHAHPALGCLDPLVSHRYMLRLTVPPGEEIMLSFLPDEVRVEPSWDEGRPRHAASPAEAIAIAAALLAQAPSGRP